LIVKELDFSHKDIKSPRFKPRQYLERYVFNEIHESFFSEFPMLLGQWITWLKYTHPKNRFRSMEWTKNIIKQLKRVNKKFTRSIDFWLDIIVVGYITEFAIDTLNYYSVEEEYFPKGPMGKVHHVVVHFNQDIIS
jgi:hypothetical protein